MITVFHTSPQPILEIKATGRFGSWLCCSLDPYFMTAADSATVYSIDIADADVIDAGSLFYHDDAAKLDALVARFMNRFGIEDEDEAQDIISERRHLDTADADDQWDVQAFTCKAAALLGYSVVKMADEQGPLYMIDGARRFADFALVI